LICGATIRAAGRLDVDGEEEGLPDPDVLEGVLALDAGIEQLVARLIEAEENGARLGTGQRAYPLGLHQALPIRHGDRIGQVHLAGDQGGNPRGVLVDRREDCLAHVALHVAPPGGIAHQDRLHAGLAFLDHEGAGAVGIELGIRSAFQVGRRRGLVLLGPLAVHDVEDLELQGQNGIGFRGDEIDRMIVDHPHRLDHSRDPIEARAGRAEPLERKGDVGGGKGIAVVEGDALAQLEAPDVGLDVFPLGGEVRAELHVLVADHQALVDVRLEPEGHGLEQGVRVQGPHVALKGPTECLGLGHAAENQRRRHADREHFFTQSQRSLPVANIPLGPSKPPYHPI
jgi:hypothetical protein